MPLPLRLLPSLVVIGLVAGAADLSGGSWLSGLSDSLWTYVVLGLSSIVTEELGPIFGGIAVHEGDLRLDRTIIALSLGGWLATTVLYWVGRKKWEFIRRRWPGARATLTVALRTVARHPIKTSLFVRFAFGLRVVLPIACGAARVPLAVYLPASLLGSAVWSTIFTLIGYAAGEAAVQMIGRLGRVGQIVGALLVTALVLLFLRWNRKRNERKAEKQRRRRATDLPV